MGSFIKGRGNRMASHLLGQARPRRRKTGGLLHHRGPRMRATLRIVSNVGLIIGQCVLLFVSRDVGLFIIIPSSLLSVPFFYKEEMWDVLALVAFMQVVNVVGLFVR
jgi:hypothetical protein